VWELAVSASLAIRNALTRSNDLDSLKPGPGTEPGRLSASPATPADFPPPGSTALKGGRQKIIRSAFKGRSFRGQPQGCPIGLHPQTSIRVPTLGASV